MKNNLTNNLNMLSPGNFKITIDTAEFSNLEFFCTTASIPGLSVSALVQGYKNNKAYFPGETIEYRPFLVKEQKILMMAQESKEESNMLLAVGDLVNACTFGKIDTKRSPTFDIEYVFLKIRAKSVGETVNINIVCPDDGQTQVPVKIKRIGYGIGIQTNTGNVVK